MDSFIEGLAFKHGEVLIGPWGPGSSGSVGRGSVLAAPRAAPCWWSGAWPPALPECERLPWPRSHQSRGAALFLCGCLRVPGALALFCVGQDLINRFMEIEMANKA